VNDEPPEGLGATTGAMRSEWQAEEDELTRAAYEQWRHGRSFVDLLGECAARGDTIHVTFPTATFRGAVVELGPDRFALAAGPGPVDVSLGADLVLGIDRSPGAAGETPPSGPSLRARLLEHEMAAADVVLGTAGTEVRGTLVVGVDHVVVTQGDLERVVPLHAIAWVRVEAAR